MDQKWQEIQRLIQNKNFITAEKKAIAAMEKSPFNFQHWAVLAEVLRVQKYYRDAYDLLHRVRVADPMAGWVYSRIEKLERLLSKSKPKKYDIHKLLDLSSVTVTAAMIINDEVENAKKWVERTREAVDQMVVVDTGSPFATREYLSREPNITLIEAEWEDSFAAVRNKAIPFLKSDWVIWIDSDEFLTDKDCKLDSIRFIASLYEKMDQKPLLKVTHLHQNRGKVIKNYDVSRMYTAREDIRFFGRVHEQIHREDRAVQMPRVNTGVEFEHTGYEAEIMKSKDKLKRNIRLLQINIEEEPWNPLWWTFLGRETRMLGKEEQALTYLKIAEEKTKEAPSYGRLLETFDLMIAIHQAKNDQINVKKTAEKMLKVNRNYPNAMYILTKLKMETAINLMKSGGNQQFAIRLISNVVQEVEEIKKACTLYRGNVTPDENIAKYKVDLLQADALRMMGETIKAKAVYEKVNKSYPHPDIQRQIEKLKMIM